MLSSSNNGYKGKNWSFQLPFCQNHQTLLTMTISRSWMINFTLMSITLWLAVTRWINKDKNKKQRRFDLRELQVPYNSQKYQVTQWKHVVWSDFMSYFQFFTRLKLFSRMKNFVFPRASEGTALLIHKEEVESSKPSRLLKYFVQPI